MIHMDSYFNIDVNLLFEQYGIKEIEHLNRKIQNEVDGKKEELRTMVGERYRDLIQAADTITEMKFTSEKIENVISKSEMINGRNKENDDISKNNLNVFNEDVFEVAAQIKILINLIELISTSIDDGKFLEATQLFLLSRHINSCLKIDSHKDIIKKFPVARKTWDLLYPFYSCIKQQCLKNLEKPNIDLEESVDCLGSLILLENGQYISSLKTFIQIREIAFLKLLTENKPAKEKLLESAMELIKLTEIVYETFLNYKGADGLIIQKFNLMNTESISLPSILLSKIPFVTNMKLIKKFKPRCNPGSVDMEAVKSIMLEWMHSIERISHKQLKDVVKYIVSIDTIREVENQIQNIAKPKNWSDICTSLFNLEDLDFYECLYQPMILERIYSIINISWDNIQNDFKNEIERLTILISDRVHRDIKHYVWSNDDLDNPQSLKDALNTEPKSHSLLMKVNGYSRHIVDICAKLDSNLKKLIDDLKNYVLSKNSIKKKQRIKECAMPDQEKLLIYLKESSKKNISALIFYTKSSVLINDAENCHLLARLLQAISEMCPNLKNCFSKNFLVDHNVYFGEGSMVEDMDHWREVSQLLINESIMLWRIWLAGFTNQWNVLKIDSNLNSYILIKEFPTWRSLIIKEKGENDQDIKSMIYIPQQLSINTQCWIFGIVSSMNKMIPHTLPKQIHLEIVEEFNKNLYQYYHSLCVQADLISNQKIAWQILFDLKILIGLFTVRDSKPRNDDFQKLITECKSAIDPFDFDVFYPYVLNNIKDNISRLQYEMGCMIPYSNYNSTVIQSQNILHIHDTEPNIISMSTSHADKKWLPLLPIIKTKGFSMDLNKEKLKLSEVKKPVLVASTSSSALSSFQEWFK